MPCDGPSRNRARGGGPACRAQSYLNRMGGGYSYQYNSYIWYQEGETIYIIPTTYQLRTFPTNSNNLPTSACMLPVLPPLFIHPGLYLFAPLGFIDKSPLFNRARTGYVHFTISFLLFIHGSGVNTHAVIRPRPKCQRDGKSN